MATAQRCYVVGILAMVAGCVVGLSRGAGYGCLTKWINGGPSGGNLGKRLVILATNEITWFSS